MSTNQKRFSIVAVIMSMLALLIFLVKDGEHSLAGRFLDAVTATKPQVYFLGVVLIVTVLALSFLAIRWLLSDRKHDRIKRMMTIIVTFSLSQLLLLVPTNTVAASALEDVFADTTGTEESNLVSVPTAAGDVNADIVIELPGFPDVAPTAEELDQIADIALAISSGFNSKSFLDRDCVWQLILIAIIIAGIVYILYKIIKACRAIAKNKKKQTGDDPENMISRSETDLPGNQHEIAASFFVKFVPQTAADLEDCGCSSPFSFDLLATNTASSAISAYRPQNLVDTDTYLIRHGLSTNSTENSFSIDRIPTNSVATIAYANNMATVNIAGKSNVTVTIDRSTNLVNWESLPSISVPVGTPLSFSDSSLSSTIPYAFYKVIVRQ